LPSGPVPATIRAETDMQALNGKTLPTNGGDHCSRSEMI
jgi:hypothetical protein